MDHARCSPAAGAVEVVTEGLPLLQPLPQERCRVALPPIAPGATLAVRAWVRAPCKGSAMSMAMLHCPTPVTATLPLAFEEPFDVKCR